MLQHAKGFCDLLVYQKSRQLAADILIRKQELNSWKNALKLDACWAA
jgi:hypothetical protein